MLGELTLIVSESALPSVAHRFLKENNMSDRNTREAICQNPKFIVDGDKVQERGWVLSPYTKKWIYYRSEEFEMSEEEINSIIKTLK